MHVCTSQLVLPIVFIVHLFNIVFYFFFYYPYGLLSEIKYYYYYYYYIIILIVSHYGMAFTLDTSKLLILDCESQRVYFLLSSLQSANYFFDDGRKTFELFFPLYVYIL